MAEEKSTVDYPPTEEEVAEATKKKLEADEKAAEEVKAMLKKANEAAEKEAEAVAKAKKEREEKAAKGEKGDNDKPAAHHAPAKPSR